jgi:gliding motility-associated-like protein
MQRLFYTTLLASVFLFLKVDGQNKSNSGKEFWLGYGYNWIFDNENPQNSQDLVLYLSTDAPATVTVSITNTSWSQTINIPANTVNISISIPKTGANDARIFNEGLHNKAVHIISDTPIVVYAHTFNTMISAATMLMPVETYGYLYYSLNYSQSQSGSSPPNPPINTTQNGPDWYSWFYVIATEDNTRLQITPSDTTRNGWLPTQTYTVSLNKGEIYNVMGKLGAGNRDWEASKDMTGSKVVSVVGADGNCHPIALFSGSSGIRLCYYDGGECMQQQMFPTQAWGTRYLTYHMLNNGSTDINDPFKNFYRIAVTDPTTIVKRNGTVLTGIIKNFYYEILDSTGGDFIEANKPVLMAQYTPGGNRCYMTNQNAYGDPEMFYLSPLEQGKKDVLFYATTNRFILFNYLNLIVSNAGLSSLRLDGNPFDPVNTKPHPNHAGYSVAVARITGSPSQHRLTCDSIFTGTMYGIGFAESYGYNVGTFINNLNSYSGVRNINSINGQIDNIITCPKTPAKILAKIAYPATSIKYKFSQVNGITPAVDWTDNAPIAITTESINGRTYYVYATTPIYEFATVGTYTIPIEYTSADINGCNNTEFSSIEIIVKPGPTANYTIAGSTCPNDNVLLNNASTTGTFNIVNYLWDFPDATTQNTPNALKTFTAIGNYNVRYRIFADNGCVGDTTKVVSIGSPQIALVSSVGKACADSVFTFTSSIMPNASNPPNWYWNFGDGTSQTITNINTVTHAYTAFASTRTLRHAVGFTQGCGTDTVNHLIPIIKQNPTASFQIKKDTLCADKPLLFTSNLTGISTWSWNFGNGIGAGVPPFIHNYATTGNYDVSLIIIDANGCGSLPTADKIYINPKPLVNAGANQTIPKNSSILLNATISPQANYIYLWAPSGTLNANNILQPRAKPNSNTTYYLLAQDATTFCSGTDSVIIKVIPVVYIPNAFTPNGDAVNPSWRIPAMAEFPNGIVTVYNRYGEKVYESKNNATNPWDGTFKGKALPMGTYTYVVQLNNVLKEIFTGTVILIR